MNIWPNPQFLVAFARLIPSMLPGKMRLAKWLLNSSLQDRDTEIRDKYGCVYKVPSLHESMAFHILVNGIYEPDVMKFLFGYLKKNSTFIDIGANVGFFSISIAKEVVTEGSVLSIEPSPTIFPYLRENVQLNNIFNISIKNFALGSFTNQLPFYDAPVDHFGMGSFSPQFHNNPIPVSVITLDDLFKAEQITRADVIKVDVEGYESAVFQGAKRTLSSDNSPIIIFEFCDWAEKRIPGQKIGDSQKILRELGYKIWLLKDFLYNKNPLSEIIIDGYEMLVAIQGLSH